jgi:hypothetical protein
MKTWAGLTAVMAKSLYTAFTSTLPQSTIERNLPHLNWPSIWALLQCPAAVDVAFSALHNILPL